MPGRQRKKVLIVDDDDAINGVVKIILEEAGFETLSAFSIASAKEILKSNKPDLVFLDIWLGKESGKEIAIFLKKHPDTEKIPIVVLSAGSEIPEIVEEIGASAFLNKPFDIDELVKMARTHVLQ